MIFLKQSTASQSVLLGPFVDDTDGVTAETGLTIAASDIRLSANGGNMAAKAAGGGTHDENGWYTITLDATDTATVGRLQISCKVAGALPVYLSCYVLEEAIYDAMFASGSTGLLPTNVTQISGDSTAADNLEAALDGTGGVTISADLDGSVASAGTIGDYVQANVVQWLGVSVSTGVATSAGGVAIPSSLQSIGVSSPSEAAATAMKACYVGTLTSFDALDAAQDAQHGATQTAVADTPTVAEFEARTLPAASYFDAATDTVDLGAVLGTALSETTGGNLAGAVEHFFDVGTPAKTVNDVGVAGSGLTAAEVRTELATELARIDVAVSTRSSTDDLGTKLSAARLQVLDDLINGGRLDLLIDAAVAQATTAATEVGKVPRAAAAVTAGGSVRRTNDDNAQTIDETITGNAP